MIWFNGLVEEAVQKALKERKIFIVYIEGDNEDSMKMTMTWDDGQVASCCNDAECVAIKIKADSLQSAQFAKCYPLLCIPSTYLINESGVPADIIPGYMDAQSFVKRIKTVLQEKGAMKATDKEKNTSEAVNAEISISGTQNNQMEEKKKEKKKQNEQSQITIAKMNQEEIESNKWINEQTKAKEETKAAREAVMLKLEQDKAEKKAKYEKEKEEQKAKRRSRKKADEIHHKDASPKESRKITRIQFRLSNGSTTTKQFPSVAKLMDLVNYIGQEEGLRNSNITLATVYPRRQFNSSELDCTLLELNLVPSAALIVISQRQSHTTSKNSILDFVRFILSPIIAVLVYIRALFIGRNDSCELDAHSNGREASKTVSQKTRYGNRSTKDDATPYEKEGNFYKFKQDDDDDEEKKTWNGNSTQQM